MAMLTPLQRPAQGKPPWLKIRLSTPERFHEIKELMRGSLSFKTDATDVIQIDWRDVARLRSSESFEIELNSGERFFGSLAAAADGELQVVGDTESPIVSLSSVARLSHLEESLLKRLEGHFDLGFSFTETDDRTEISIGAEAKYRTPK